MKTAIEILEEYEEQFETPNFNKNVVELKKKERKQREQDIRQYMPNVLDD
jgi:hypothetical protein